MALRPIWNSEIFAYMLHVYPRQPIHTTITAGTSSSVVVTVYQFFPGRESAEFCVVYFVLPPLHRKPPTEKQNTSLRG
jgi:hypothetical protein